MVFSVSHIVDSMMIDGMLHLGRNQLSTGNDTWCVPQAVISITKIMYLCILYHRWHKLYLVYPKNIMTCKEQFNFSTFNLNIWNIAVNYLFWVSLTCFKPLVLA